MAYSTLENNTNFDKKEIIDPLIKIQKLSLLNYLFFHGRFELDIIGNKMSDTSLV